MATRFLLELTKSKKFYAFWCFFLIPCNIAFNSFMHFFGGALSILLLFVTGIGLLMNKKWARVLCLIVAVVSILYSIVIVILIVFFCLTAGMWGTLIGTVFFPPAISLIYFLSGLIMICCLLSPLINLLIAFRYISLYRQKLI